MDPFDHLEVHSGPLVRIILILTRYWAAFLSLSFHFWNYDMFFSLWPYSLLARSIYKCTVCIKCVLHTYFILISFWRRNFFFQILAHPVFKMWVIQKPNKVALWNKRNFEEKKRRLYSMFKIFSTDICWINTGCFTTLGHNCRRWFPRSLWSKKFI